MQKEREIRFQQISKRQQVFHSAKSLSDDGVSEGCKSSVKLKRAPLSQNQQNPQSTEAKGSNHCSSNGTSAVVDKIKLGDEGWKERFYAEKFEAKSEDERDTIRRHAVSKYVEGICWVMHYYYEGVCSWQCSNVENWIIEARGPSLGLMFYLPSQSAKNYDIMFYPYHYAPFASDFYGCGQLEIQFTLGEPFKPFDQLMAVLPAARKLMTDASSPLLDFYPTDFELDMNGKRFSWQAICKLPFIEESRLLSEIAKVEHMLTDEERQRNRLGYDFLCIHVSHPLAVKIIFLSECEDQSTLPKANAKLKIDPKISGGMNGYVYISDKLDWPLEIHSPIDGMPTIVRNQVISVFYEYPPFHSHIPRLPEGVILPKKSVTKCNILQANHLWHDPAVSGRVSSKRQIPKSISGPQLAKLARRLVSTYNNSSKHLGIHRCAKPGFPRDADRMGQMRTQVQTKKRKWGKSNRNHLDGRSKESRGGKNDFVPIIDVKKLGSSILRQRRKICGDNGSAGVEEIKTDKSKKRKRRSKKTKHKQGAGIPDGVEKPESSIKQQINSDDKPAGADGENDNKEAKSRKRQSRKRKQRNKKGNQDNGDDVLSKKAENLGSCNHIRELPSCILQEQSGGDVHAGGVGALELKTEVKFMKRKKNEPDGIRVNNVEKLESCALVEKRGVDVHAGRNGALELRSEVKSKKRKQRSKKKRKIEADGILINNAEKSESCALPGTCLFSTS
ncbi:unnamed protein product [Dovyalis caffra]|uniref:Xrn1 helical domain-containing protein n=1 Tax=Dovyalis caffra TaxID=77055 RepID=A0AAV1RZS7_9ROSI|nr:unnamed protein product [Dovyalis caffra]